MDSNIVAAFIGLGGIVLGVILTAAFNWAQGRARQKDQKVEYRRVLTLLQAECERNQVAFVETWDKVTSNAYWVPNTGYTFAEQEFHKRLRLVRLPLPVWSRQIWEGDRALIRKAIDATKIIDIAGLYADLDAFTSVRAKLLEAFNTETNKKLADDFTAWMEAKSLRTAQNKSMSSSYERDIHAAISTFNDQTLELWNECQVIAEHIKKYHSPIPQP